MPDPKPIGDQHAWSETHQWPKCLIGDQDAWLETHWRPKCLIRDPSETDMPCQKPIDDQHASLETNMLDRRPTLGKICFSYGSPMQHVGLRSGIWVSDKGYRSPMGLWLGMSVFDDACRSPMRHVGLRWGMSVSDETCRSLLRQVGLRWVFNQACRSPMSLRSPMSISDGSSMGLRWVSDRASIIIIFSWTQPEPELNQRITEQHSGVVR